MKFKPGDIVMIRKPWTNYVGVVTRDDHHVPGLTTPYCVMALYQFNPIQTAAIAGCLTNYALDDGMAMVCPGENI